MTVVRFGPVVRDERAVHFKYDKDVIAIIKTIPADCRSWNAEGKYWTVKSGKTDELATALRDAGHSVLGVSSSPAQRSIGCNWAQEMFRAVGPQRAPMVHRALTKILHPDTSTGDCLLQQQLNDAYTTIGNGRKGAS